MIPKNKVTSKIVYGICPLYLKNGLNDITVNLEYYSRMGINAFWISPMMETPEGGHGYDVSNYYELRRDFGKKTELKELVDQAHKKGIKIYMDFVPNHTSIYHPYMKDVQQKGKQSPYYNYYDRDENGNYTYYFDWDHLPNLNYDNLKVIEWLTDAICYWVREFDIDGFRMDAVWGIKKRRPDFWPACRQALDRIKNDVLLIAEASARDPYYFYNGFEVAYDWTDELGHWSMENVFTKKEGLVDRLDEALTNEGRGFHDDAIIFRFLNNNDTGKRFITRYGVDMTRVAAVMLLTLPGVPCIYMGQEVGAEYEPYKKEGTLSFQDKHGLFDYYQKLINIRKSVPALQTNSWQKVVVDPADKVYAYLRPGNEYQRSALIILNFSGENLQVEVEWPEEFKQKLKDLVTGENIMVTDKKIAVAKSRGLILVNSE
ncbi:MAG: alpha-amylase family glycosyl hydrolase [bacterium]